MVGGGWRRKEGREGVSRSHNAIIAPTARAIRKGMRGTKEGWNYSEMQICPKEVAWAASFGCKSQEVVA